MIDEVKLEGRSGIAGAEDEMLEADESVVGNIEAPVVEAEPSISAESRFVRLIDWRRRTRTCGSSLPWFWRGYSRHSGDQFHGMVETG